jgi:putative transposase
VRANLTGSLRQVQEDIEDDIDERNAEAARKAALAAANGDGDFEPIELLRVPDIKTVARARSQVDPFRVSIAKWGKDAAVRLHPAVRGTADVQEAMGRIEYDESVVDVIILLTESGVWALMTPEERKAVKKVRMVIGVAICVVSKCILAMRIYPVGNAAETVATIRMITEDKTKYIPVHLREQLSWHQCGGIGGVTVDQGSSNISDVSRTTFANLDVPIDIAPAANPQDRGAGERIFRTFASEIYSLLDARTGSNVIDRRQYRPEGRASLTIDELWAILVIGIVGIYHNSPHAGLGGRTPAEEWERVTADYGIRALPDPNRRRVAFGRRKTREVTRYGVTYGGLSYTNPLIDHHYLHGRGKVEVVGDHEDLGAVSLKIGETWYEALCTDPDMRGVRLEDWLAASATQKDIADDDVRKRKAARRAAKQALRAIQESARGRAAERPTASIEQLEEAAVKRIFGKYEHAEEDQPVHDGQLGIAVEPDNDAQSTPAAADAAPAPAKNAGHRPKGANKWKMK